MKLGIQLYSVRDQLDKDFPGTLRKLAEMGFEGVEFAGNYGGMAPAALAGFLGETRLACCGMHVGLNNLQDAGSAAYEAARLLKSPHVTTSCCGKSDLANWDATIAAIANAGRVAATQGFRFTYHNHATEFERRDGATLLDTLYARTEALHVKAELDTAWISAGGQDPVAYIAKYAGRVPQVHAKDYSTSGKTLIEIGRGDLDFRAIAAAAHAAGTEWLIYELDASTIGDSLSSAREAAPILAPLCRPVRE
jgi:sugar phosphate isomerase/epimerase